MQNFLSITKPNLSACAVKTGKYADAVHTQVMHLKHLYDGIQYSVFWFSTTTYTYIQVAGAENAIWQRTVDLFL